MIGRGIFLCCFFFPYLLACLMSAQRLHNLTCLYSFFFRAVGAKTKTQNTVKNASGATVHTDWRRTLRGCSARSPAPAGRGGGDVPKYATPLWRTCRKREKLRFCVYILNFWPIFRVEPIFRFYVFEAGEVSWFLSQPGA